MELSNAELRSVFSKEVDENGMSALRTVDSAPVGYNQENDTLKISKHEDTKVSRVIERAYYKESFTNTFEVPTFSNGLLFAFRIMNVNGDNVNVSVETGPSTYVGPSIEFKMKTENITNRKTFLHYWGEFPNEVDTDLEIACDIKKSGIILPAGAALPTYRVKVNIEGDFTNGEGIEIFCNCYVIGGETFNVL